MLMKRGNKPSERRGVVHKSDEDWLKTAGHGKIYKFLNIILSHSFYNWGCITCIMDPKTVGTSDVMPIATFINFHLSSLHGATSRTISGTSPSQYGD